ncbi:MAG: hypothetical protein Ta2B_23090 [Termitinemataceae bacterium]|nr:MAG: hypothetical protein Ta2B_23090 [Termitinemataceae bacterium]
MDKSFFFEHNLQALSTNNSKLCTRLSAANPKHLQYNFLTGRDGNIIPAYIDKTGEARPLHSLIAAQKEADRIAATLSGESYIIVLGLGGGYTVSAAINCPTVKHILLIDYDIDGFAELLCKMDFAILFKNKKLNILIDPSQSEIENHILSTYNPCLQDGIRALPLRARCDFDTEHFIPAADAIKSAIDKVSSDYSVQVYFGKRWFSNILRNVFAAEKHYFAMPTIQRAAICAAGPSLDLQIDAIKTLVDNEQRSAKKNVFLLATDTSLGTLLQAGIKPDAVISIDCQHISYYHFVGYNIKDIPLFLDIASPPHLSQFSDKVCFFLSAHPLSTYIENFFRPLPKIDTSGANVTYAALSLAEQLGAMEIEIFGADFSYPLGNVYTRGAYFYPHFHRKQNRFKPIELSIAAFLYKAPSLQTVQKDNSWYYETRSLKMYRQAFEKKTFLIDAKVKAAHGLGAEINVNGKSKTSSGQKLSPRAQMFSSGKLKSGAKDFLQLYKKLIQELDNNIESGCRCYKNPIDYMIWNSILPTASAIKHKDKIDTLETLAEETKKYCIDAIEKVLSYEHL